MTIIKSPMHDLPNGQSFFGPSPPKVQPIPSPPQRDEAAETAEAELRRRRRRGYASTVLTKPDLPAPNVGTRTLLGQ